MSLAHMHHKTAFELLPDLLPPFFSVTEMELWSLFYEDLNAREALKNNG